MNPSISLENQLLATKFYVPVALGRLISRPRLTTLLNESLKRPFTLVSAPAGFGKTMLLSAWAQSLPASHALVAWLSLDEEDNDPQLFWTYILSALDTYQPEGLTSLLKARAPRPRTRPAESCPCASVPMAAARNAADARTRHRTPRHEFNSMKCRGGMS